ncbi:MAG TPA: DUF2079 domain-containing protein [Bacteroidales bacterium]|nr:DUF2079 domain-containing protein [Bacteroidales bacterium]HPS16372.1 DUF2079 domain-containing protein [Bacteroidales bacterium]
MLQSNDIKFRITKASVFFFFAMLYGIISLVNHYMFRTNAHDYGIYNQTLWDYAHFRINNNSVIQPGFGNILSDHFELLLMLISPFYYIFGSYTLLIFQVISILVGGQGVFKYVELISENKKFALAASIHFFLFFAIYSALAFDYHNNVPGTMTIPWIFYFIHKNQWKQTFFCLIILLISKENMALWGFFIFISLIIKYRNEKKKILWSGIFAGICIVYFLLVVKLIIPSLGSSSGSGGNYLHFRYAALGSNMTEAIKTIITKPLYALKLLFVNHLGNPDYNYIKAELHIIILLSGGILLFFRPYYLLMLLPVYGQKMFCDYFTYWGLGYHYSIEFAPIITIGAFTFLNDIKKEKTKNIIVYSLLIITAIVTAHTFDSTRTHFIRQKQRFYTKPHYVRNFDIKESYTSLKLIPADAKVCAQDEFVSHLCFRRNIYVYPSIEDADYIYLNTNSNIYPYWDDKKYLSDIDSLRNAKEWENIYDKNFTLIFKRKK